MTGFFRVLGKKTKPLEENDLAVADRYSGVEVDIGTGDGRYVLEAAKADPERFFIGIDAVAENMKENARRAGASIRKGGVENVLFVRGATGQFPGPFAAIADRLTVLYPWGSLLRYLTLPESDALRSIRAVCKDQIPFEFLINFSVFRDPQYLERLGLPEDVHMNETLPDVYCHTGFRVEERSVFVGDPQIRTNWGRRLVRGSNRETLLIAGETI